MRIVILATFFGLAISVVRADEIRELNRQIKFVGTQIRVLDSQIQRLKKQFPTGNCGNNWLLKAAPKSRDAYQKMISDDPSLTAEDLNLYFAVQEELARFRLEVQRTARFYKMFDAATLERQRFQHCWNRLQVEKAKAEERKGLH